MNEQATLQKVQAWAKRRGFAYPSSEIYGGLANSWDFGHYGTLLKNNLRDYWWKTFVLDRDDMVGIDASIFLKPDVWEASGHLASFTNDLIDCKTCHYRTRADHLIEDNLEDKKVEGLPLTELDEIIKSNNLKCPKCGKSDWTPARKFNQLFETSLGIIVGEKNTAYLRGEIAQGLFLNFKNVVNSMRVRIPFGIAQQGKAFRNEITLGQFVHRTSEFDLMEFEYFIKEDEWEKIFEYWKNFMWQFTLDLGIKEGNLHWREHEKFELSHYSKKTMDIEYHYPFGWKEMFGLAYRTDFDLKNHSEKSGKDLSYMDPYTKEKYIPHVIEPTFGLSRLIGIILFDAYREEEVNGKLRTYLKVKPALAPVKAAVFPLQRDEVLVEKAKAIADELRRHFVTEFDNSGNIGQMYRRQDEIGTPFCITVDYESESSGSVTVRERDTMKQERVAVEDLVKYIEERIQF